MAAGNRTRPKCRQVALEFVGAKEGERFPAPMNCLSKGFDGFNAYTSTQPEENMKRNKRTLELGVCAILGVAMSLIAGCASTLDNSHTSDVMHFVPVGIAAGEPVDGWRVWGVRLALVNDADETLKFGPLQDSIVITEEGYQYPAKLIDSAFYDTPIPPGFRAVSRRSEYTRFSFRAAASSTPSELILLPNQESEKISRHVDISQVTPVQYPVAEGQLNNIPELVGATLEVPELALVSFYSVSSRREEYFYNDAWSLVIDASFLNDNQGYNNKGRYECVVFDQFGSAYHAQSRDFEAGPSQTSEFTIRIPYDDVNPDAKSLEEGILWCKFAFFIPGNPLGEEQEMFTRLPSVIPIADQAP